MIRARQRAMAPTPRGLFHATRDPTIISIADLRFGGVVLGGRGLTFMIRKRGNPNWMRPMLPASVLCTEFEMQARQLHLTPEQCVVSAELRNWCERNRNRFYIPEWLLDAWDIPVDPDLSGAA
jgi:hypothetical protein